MRIFAQYLRAGDVINTARGRFVILGSRDEVLQTLNGKEVLYCQMVEINAEEGYPRLRLPLLLHSPYTVLSHITEERKSRMKLPPPGA